MQFKNIQGIDVPEIGLGTYRLHDRECSKSIRMALDIGYRHIDTAQMYKNEREIGEAIKISNVPREDIFLTTKIWHTNLEHDDVLQSTEESLRNLDTPYVDLLLIHWPNEQYNLRETIRAMLVLRDQGKAVNIGVSNFPLSLLKKVNEEIRAPIFCNQVEYHPFLGQLDMLDYAIENNILITAYSPLAQGRVNDSKELQQIGENHGKTPAQIALRWLIEQENVVAIPKSASRKHLEENIDIFDFQLSDEEFEQIDNLNKSTRLTNPSFAPDWD
ncbi:MAG: aldo/keto reductase [Balneolaceae bacterium]|nr:aldo/keto reductase [Balneolaceae bacterium]